MSYHSEHQRMKPVLDLARKLDIACNPSSQALFEAGTGGFQVWCIPQDRPRGWSDVPMHPGSFYFEHIGDLVTDRDVDVYCPSWVPMAITQCIDYRREKFIEGAGKTFVDRHFHSEGSSFLTL